MKFKIIDEIVNFDKTKSVTIKLSKRDLIFFGYILESFEGWGNYTTINHDKDITLKVIVSPSYIKEYEELLNYLANYEQ